MIRLTKLDGQEFIVNHEMIETIESIPDTLLTLSNGHRYLVKEPAETVVERIIAFKARLLRQAPPGAAVP